MLLTSVRTFALTAGRLNEPLVKKPVAKKKRRILSDDEDDSESTESSGSAQHVDPVVEPLTKLSLEFDVPNSAWRLRYDRTASAPSLPSESSATEYRVPQAG